MSIIILLILIYMLNTYNAYKYVQIAHSNKGRWSTLHPNTGDLFFTVMPIFHISPAIGYLTGSCFSKSYRPVRYYYLDKFFRINKEVD